ncbi:peptide synthetase, partial [Arthrobacter deserti]|nr:peptide synthetase [Arthrobacter deserti]
TGNGGDYQPPVTETETLLAEQLAAVLNVERVSATAHFFEDLGMNSLLMANLSAAVRRQGGLPPVAVQDMYQNPDIRRLAAVLDEAKAPAGPEPAGPAAGMREPHRATGFQYAMCGLLQLAVFLAYSFLAAAMPIAGYEWAAGGSSWWDTVLRSLGMALAVFFGLGTLPILLKWVLIGRWKPQEIPIWTLRYVRFWFVKTLLQANPFQAFVATPLYPLYLRALGARIGRRVTFLSSVPPVCADLLTVGDDTVLRRGVVLQCHRARAGRLVLGPVTLGSNVYVGERTVLDIRTSMGDGAQLGHSSSLHAGQHVPAGQSWHGSPARRAATDYRVVEPVPCTLRRRIAYSLWVIANRLFLMLTLGFALAVSLLDAYLESGHLEHGTAAFYLDALLFSLVLFYGGLVTAFALVLTVPRLLSRFLVPGRTYPVYGFHYALQRTVARLTNVRLFMQITGDSSLVVHYLQALGYKQPGLVQTGSNYGVELSHDSPYLTTVGSGTMVSDGLAISNADFSSTSFRVSETVIGAKNFFGNNIGYPVGG